MQDKIKKLNEEVNHLRELGLKERGSYEKNVKETRKLQNKLDTCENQNQSFFGSRSDNQSCQQKIEGIELKINQN